MSAAYPISDEQVRFYQDNGYIQLLHVLTPEELVEARAALAGALDLTLDATHDRTGRDAEYDRVFTQKVNLWQVHDGMRRYTFNPKLAEIARRLTLARQIRLWHDHALIKMPDGSKPSAWHQDLPYWPMVESGALSCWMALDDVTEANGCMAFVPGSHRFGRLPPINLVNPQDLFDMVPADVRGNAPMQPAFQPMPAGSCTFHSGTTFHYAGPNTSDRPRRALVTIYMPDDVHYNGKRHIVTDDLGLQEGDLLAGERFPVLAEGPA